MPRLENNSISLSRKVAVYSTTRIGCHVKLVKQSLWQFGTLCPANRWFDNFYAAQKLKLTYTENEKSVLNMQWCT